MQPLVPGFTITSELSSDANGSTWGAVRTLDNRSLVLRIIRVSDLAVAQAQATEMTAVLDRIANEHLVGQHGAIALADGALCLVLDQVAGVGLAQILGDRGHLTPGEIVTTVAPLFGALADLHAAGVVHGDLTAGSVLFSPDGRPLISDLGAARLLGPAGGPVNRSGCFVAPEVVSGAMASPASDVFAMAAIGWFCLTGAAPAPGATRPSLVALMPETPARLVDALASCLSAAPTARPSARAAAIKVFEAAPAESVVLASVSDPATEITRRIRSTAASVPVLAPTSTSRRLRRPLAIGVVALLVAVAVGGGATWFLRRPAVVVAPAAVRTMAKPSPKPPGAAASIAPATIAPATIPTATTARRMTDVVTAPDSPRIAPARLLQALVDARALAYVARNPVLLDLVYAPGATKAGVDRGNIVTALDNGATYLGLAFVVKDAAFLGGTSTTARMRALIVTPAYQTGQPDGRKVPHAQETVGPSVFTLSLTRDGWRILGLAAP